MHQIQVSNDATLNNSNVITDKNFKVLSRGSNYIIESARSVCDLYGFEEFSTPIMEFSEVFDRSLGNSSDIITKETYNFYDKNGESVTLRPEGTAAIARAFLSNSFFLTFNGGKIRITFSAALIVNNFLSISF